MSAFKSTHLPSESPAESVLFLRFWPQKQRPPFTDSAGEMIDSTEAIFSIFILFDHK